jgi:hypothetical protein
VPLAEVELQLSNEQAVTKKNATLYSLIPWLAVMVSSLVYTAHSFWGGGSGHRIMDSWAYLQVSSGESAGVPFDIRVLVPWLATQIASFSGLSVSAAYNLLTSLALLGSLLILKERLTRRGSSWQWQTAVLLAFGCSLAVTFGYTPILVDPFLLLVTCLTILALDNGKLFVGLALTVVAVLTKEFGLFLAPIWAVYVYRRGFRRFALFGLVAPVATLVILLLARHSNATFAFSGWKPYTFHYLFDYQLSVLRLRGSMSYVKLLYMGAWCGLWPTLLVASMCIRPRAVRSAGLDVYRIGWVISLLCLPLLLLGDWSRNLIVLVPFASVLAASHPLARDRYFVGLIAIGGLATALARPFHSDSPNPQLIVVGVTIVSLISSLLIATRIVQFVTSTSGESLDTNAAGSAPEVLA